jgi:hypothetical protein
LRSAQANNSQHPISKITKAKWTVAKVVEHLLCNCETLSSNPNPIKKKKKKNLGRAHNVLEKFIPAETLN